MPTVRTNGVGTCYERRGDGPPVVFIHGAILDHSQWALQRVAMLNATVPAVRRLGYERVERAMVWLRERVAAEGVSGDSEKVGRLRETGPKMETTEFVKVVRAIAEFHRTSVDYGAISVPTPVLYGEREPLFVRRHGSRLRTELPNATVRVVPGAGHASNLDDPAFFTVALREFLGGLARSPVP